MKGEPLRGEVRGTFILRRKGIYYKVLTVRRTEDGWWLFNCTDLKSKKKTVLKYRMLGMLELLDHVYNKMKAPQDILLVDLDDQGAVKIMTKEQIDKAMNDS
ncbi:MAG: hypothetical protein P8X84_01950 [Candidatus Bathyarchaeota archaeon]